MLSETGYNFYITLGIKLNKSYSKTLIRALIKIYLKKNIKNFNKLQKH